MRNELPSSLGLPGYQRCNTFGLPEDGTHLVDEVLAVVVGKVLSSDNSVSERQLLAS